MFRCSCPWTVTSAGLSKAFNSAFWGLYDAWCEAGEPTRVNEEDALTLLEDSDAGYDPHQEDEAMGDDQFPEDIYSEEHETPSVRGGAVEVDKEDHGEPVQVLSAAASPGRVCPLIRKAHTCDPNGKARSSARYPMTTASVPIFMISMPRPATAPKARLDLDCQLPRHQRQIRCLRVNLLKITASL